MSDTTTQEAPVEAQDSAEHEAAAQPATKAEKAPQMPSDPRPGVEDFELLTEFRKGDASAFEALVLRHTKLTFSFIYRMVGNQNAADDLFQETWLKVLRKAHTYRPTAKFTTWLLQIARNSTYDYFKRENLRQHVSLDAQVLIDEGSMASLVPSKGPQPEEVLLSAEMFDAVQKAICRLPIKQQEALVLRVYEKMPYADIAELLEAPEGTVKYWVHESIRLLTNYLETRGVV
ncbi:MAG: sigma-70 family RNA polymerase sigma factor [Planctomycetes bacterium]|nr:sigma-70 family RNA polymerase sigma factor [Planctomycetota bacterium]